jgi:phosphate transport system protein
MGPGAELDLDQQIAVLFALVSEALAKATDALLKADPGAGQGVVDADLAIDEMTHEVERLVWAKIDSGTVAGEQLRHLVGLLLILPELERSADLAEHIAQRAVDHLGVDMSPLSRGIVQRMTEVALEMWHTAAEAYAHRTAQGTALSEDDEEIDILHERLTQEIAGEGMPAAVAAQVALLARFYERLGDHAVNVARRIDTFRTGDQ